MLNCSFPASNGGAEYPLVEPLAGTNVRVRHRSALLDAGIRATLASTAGDAGRQPRSSLLGGRPVLITDPAQAPAWTRAGDTAVLVVASGLTAAAIRGLLQAGVDGCIGADASPEELLRAVGALRQGGTYLCPETSGLIAGTPLPFALTGREAQVLAWLCDGLDNKSIAQAMQITVGTVKCHVKALLAKTGAATRTALAAQAIRQGWATTASHGERP